MDAKDRILEALQHNGDWMTLDQIQRSAGIVSLVYITKGLKDFVDFQVVQTKDEGRKGRRWKAVMEPA